MKNRVPNNATSTAMRAAKLMAMIQAARVSVAARSTSDAPRARAVAADMAPPIAPAESICVSITSGNTNASPANAVTPRRLAK